eukprot:3187333-Rhodomonas_salina.1
MRNHVSLLHPSSSASLSSILIHLTGPSMLICITLVGLAVALSGLPSSDALLESAAGPSEVQIQPMRKRSRPRKPFWNLLRREVESLLGADRKRITEWQRVYFTLMLAPATAWQGTEGRQRLLALMEYSSLAIINDPQKKLSEEPFSFPAGDISRVVSNSLAQEPVRKELVCLVRGTGTGKT